MAALANCSFKSQKRWVANNNVHFKQRLETVGNYSVFTLQSLHIAFCRESKHLVKEVHQW